MDETLDLAWTEVGAKKGGQEWEYLRLLRVVIDWWMMQWERVKSKKSGPISIRRVLTEMRNFRGLEAKMSFLLDKSSSYMGLNWKSL